MDSSSSRWPLPAMPAMPSTSPALTVKLTSSRRLTPSSSNTVKPSSTRRGVTFTGSGRSMFRLTAVAHHHIRQGLLVGVLGGHVADILALAEHRHPVGDVQHLMELVGDDDEGLAVRLHVPHDLEQLVRLLRRQDGGRLVQDQNIRAPDTGP